MRFKKGLIATAVVLALAIPVTAFAATSDSQTAVKIRGLFGIDSSKLTTAQVADLQDYAQKMADLQKSLLDKMVSNGLITQAQADAQKAQIDSNLASGNISIDFGKGGQNCQGKIDLSKLTDDQKNTLLGFKKDLLTAQSNLADIMVEQGLITQAQADTIKTKVDADIASLNTSDLTRENMNEYAGCLNMLHGVTLTDAQKAALLGWASNTAAIEKKVVALYKDAGVITQAQADAMNAQIDSWASDPLAFPNMLGGKMGMENGKMGRGEMGGGHKGQGFDKNASSGSTQTTPPTSSN